KPQRHIGPSPSATKGGGPRWLRQVSSEPDRLTPWPGPSSWTPQGSTSPYISVANPLPTPNASTGTRASYQRNTYTKTCSALSVALPTCHPLRSCGLRVKNLTTMRKLKHPIAVFVMTVLIVIGIGVGVVAATTSQKVYGPSWGQFTASFS